MTPQELAATCQALIERLGHIIRGQGPLIEDVLIALLARGHVLLEGVPGTGKTLLVRSLARLLGCDSCRLQFTPDLMPSDVTGGNIYNQGEGRFEFAPGPIFTPMLLADEINRAPAKTQSALLEAMQDRTVSADGVTRVLPKPFFVLATQNPVESQGTYPLPEAQLDRFLIMLEMGLPPREAERAVLLDHIAGFRADALDALKPLMDVEGITAMQACVDEVTVAEEVLDYLLDVIARTRNHGAIEHGASTRAAVALLSTARARAAVEGRGFITPDDVKTMAVPVLRHRLILHPDAEFEGTTALASLEEILRLTPVPGGEAS
ncbi:MoxR family ATPase [Myxococcota bacterium]|nr:MoxR family ATPase [Myxococcota bacterium]MBU1431998.1 MoxR family ATPase [Myxococcota bacterium]MBU1897036.1 MoxR family ATPase [Myxococcota bacterium]